MRRTMIDSKIWYSGTSVKEILTNIAIDDENGTKDKTFANIPWGLIIAKIDNINEKIISILTGITIAVKSSVRLTKAPRIVYMEAYKKYPKMKKTIK